MAQHPEIVVRALSWNIFHGRELHARAHRPLLHEFAMTVAAQPWHVAFLQEAPPRWLLPLARASRSGGASALTSRNFGAAARAAVASIDPELLRSNEGGSNQLLVRPPWRIAEVRRLTLTRRPERRRMIWALLQGPGGRELTVAGLHASVPRARTGERDVMDAAALALEWAGGAPLVFGGDLNLRPERSRVFRRLEALGLAGPVQPDAIDHLLARGLDVVEPAHRLPSAARELRGRNGRLLQLSDHDIVAGAFGMK